MAIIKCKMCGGNMEISADKTYGTCDSCGSTMTFPRVSDEQRVNLFNRANHFRRQNEFDKAIAAYERILEEDADDAEAHWGIVLSRYGIEYVEDPISHERIPTCHRVHLGSILADPDLLSAMEHAPDAYSAQLYQKEAEQIAQIQKGILAISAQEEPYDVFICYKESTDGGSRTKDSTIAQDIYYQLTGEGYKVFFARITLESKLGQQYEPYIFAALNSARVMLAIGTKPEHFSAVWVKNEWSRFLALMKQDRTKLLIPCYRDMDPYDLPEELSALQSQDMSKIGFMQDLLHGIRKVVEGDKTDGASSAAAPGVKSLLTRAQLFLEDGDFASANEYADKVLDIDPKYAPAYIVKVQVREKVRKEADLAYCKHPLSDNADYQKAVRFADVTGKTVYESYNLSIIKRMEEERRQEKYQDLCSRSLTAAKEETLEQIASELEQLQDYKDAAQWAEKCRERAQHMREERLQREAEAKAKREREQAAALQRREQESLERKRRAEQERIAAEKRKAQNLKIAKIVSIVLVVMILLGGTWTFILSPAHLYKQANFARIEGNYSEAISTLQEVAAAPGFSVFSGIGGFSDAETVILQCEADQLFAAGDYVAALDIYNTLDSRYHTHADRYQEMYQAAAAQMENGEAQEAIAAFKAIINYSDSAARIAAYNYSDAQAKLSSGDLTNARKAFVLAGDYKDAPEMIQAIDDYNTASAMMDTCDYASARNYFAHLTILDSAEKLEDCYAADYAAADALYTSGDVAGAHDAFLAIAEYSDSAARAEQIETDYATAASLMEAGNYDEAIAIYATLGNYGDSVQNGFTAHYRKGLSLWEKGETFAAEEELVYVSQVFDVADDLQALRLEIADSACDNKQYNVALTYYLQLPQTNELKAREYNLAQTCYDEGYFAQSVQAYEVLGQYELSISKLPVARYAYAAQLFENGNYAEAAEQFTMLNGSTDSTERATESTYHYGKQLMAQSQCEDAKAVLAPIASYKDVGTLVKECNYQLAETELAAGHYVQARSAYQQLNGYADSADKATLCTYEQGNAYIESGDYTAAEKAFSSISDYEDSAEKVKLCRYEQGNTCFSAGNYTGALNFYTDLGYQDSENLAARCHCALGQQQRSAGNTEDAVREYAQAVILSEAQAALYDIGKDFAATNQNEKAIETLWACGNYTPALTMLAEIADLLEKNGNTVDATIARYAIWSNGDTESTHPDASIDIAKGMADYGLLPEKRFVHAIWYAAGEAKREARYFDSAVVAFTNAGDYNDAKVQISATYYAQGEALRTAGDWDGAISAFTNASEYSDAKAQIKETHYQHAHECMSAGNYSEAYHLFDQIRGYKDVNTLLTEILELKFVVGNYVTFGNYPQTKSGTDNTPIEWLVLDRNGNYALLLSRYGLDAQPYHSQATNTTWENCTLRAWLNNDFINRAFTDAEQSAILLTNVDNSSSQCYSSWSTSGGSDTQDKVFLLSYAEANKYLGVTYTDFNNTKACVAPTAYAIAQNAYINNNRKTADSEAAGWWWLRSPGFNKNIAAYVRPDGSLYCGTVSLAIGSVRPALWVNIESGIF